MHIVLIYGGGNDLGRAYCLWLLAQELGWTVSAYAADNTWLPLTETGFDVANVENLTTGELKAADAAVIYQPVPLTLGRVCPILEESRIPFLVDYDDPHWEQSFGYSPAGKLRVILGLLRRRRSPIIPYRLRHLARKHHSLAASPFVQTSERSSLIPHVRQISPYVPMPSLDRLQIGFVGTPSAHKGIDRLREAVSSVGDVDLWVTGEAPSDALAHENWTGMTSLAGGRAVLNRCHVSAVLQASSRWSRQQFPVKVVDAMMAGRVVIASDVPPVRWALNSTGVLIPPGNRNALLNAIRHLRDNVNEVASLGANARREAAVRFTPGAVAPVFKQAVLSAVAEAVSGS